MLIYKITNDINSKIYIGQTTKSLDDRIATHYNSMISGCDTHLYRAMRKYGWEHFQFSIIANAVDQDTLNELEAYYIAKFDTIANGYNMAPGGNINTMYSKVVADKHRNVMRSEAVRRKISESMKQSYAKRGGPSAEHRKHLSDSRKRLYASEKGAEVKAKFRQSYKLSDAHFKALNDAKNKRVYCINTSEQIIHEFERVKDAAEWWWHNGYDSVRSPEQLSDRIKESARSNKFIRGLKWVYRV